VRNKALALTLATLIQPQFSFAHDQDPAQNGSQPTANSSQNTPTQQMAAADAPAQPLSVAEMARLARAKKQGDGALLKAAPVKIVLDDDNMPRGVYAADVPTSGSASDATPRATSSAPGGSGPFAEFRGKVILLDFWASWCGPCRSALPNLKRLQAVYGAEDFVVVSISEDDDEAAWHAFTAAHQMTWPQRLDSGNKLQRLFGVNALPTYILIGRDGTMVQRVVGENPAQSIMERIGPELKKSLAANAEADRAPDQRTEIQ